ncbi:hypothetical protein AAG570_007621 [Ranatra chinensis]|uniref:Uncharacterized protein n=1 Tax=Ranatra chinensis TaxID=642074 RepID=A0ABD0XU16_9HEMI
MLQVPDNEAPNGLQDACHSLVNVLAKDAVTARGRDWNAIKSDGWAQSVSEEEINMNTFESIYGYSPFFVTSVLDHPNTVALILRAKGTTINAETRYMLLVLWTACGLFLGSDSSYCCPGSPNHILKSKTCPDNTNITLDCNGQSMYILDPDRDYFRIENGHLLLPGKDDEQPKKVPSIE